LSGLRELDLSDPSAIDLAPILHLMVRGLQVR